MSDMTVRGFLLGLSVVAVGVLAGCASNGCKSITAHTSVVGESDPSVDRAADGDFGRRGRVEFTYDTSQAKSASTETELQDGSPVQIGGDIQIVYTAYDSGSLGGSR